MGGVLRAVVALHKETEAHLTSEHEARKEWVTEATLYSEGASAIRDLIKVVESQEAEIERLQAKLPTGIEWLAVDDALEFTAAGSGCVSDAHIRVSNKVKAFCKSAEAAGGEDENRQDA